MKILTYLSIIVLFALLAVGGAGADNPWVYTCKTTSVTSSTVPVNVLAASTAKAWFIHVRSIGAAPVLTFPYQGTIPGAAPANVMEIAAGGFFSDNVNLGDTTIQNPLGEAWGAVLSTGATAVTVDACWR